MKKLILILILFFVPVQLQAEQVNIAIPGQNWKLSFDAPPLSDKKESRRGGEYVFKANSGRFNISFFVEVPKGDGRTHRDCYAYYWPLASRNPNIDKDSIKMSESNKYVRVQYDIVHSFGDKKIIHRNVNYYFCHKNKWVDVHISVIMPVPEDNQILKTFDKTLGYGN